MPLVRSLPTHKTTTSTAFHNQDCAFQSLESISTPQSSGTTTSTWSSSVIQEAITSPLPISSFCNLPATPRAVSPGHPQPASCLRASVTYLYFFLTATSLVLSLQFEQVGDWFGLSFSQTASPPTTENTSLHFIPFLGGHSVRHHPIRPNKRSHTTIYPYLFTQPLTTAPPGSLCPVQPISTLHTFSSAFTHCYPPSLLGYCHRKTIRILLVGHIDLCYICTGYFLTQT